LAQRVHENVLATQMELTEAPIEALRTAPVEAVAPTGEPVELAQAVETPPATNDEPVTMASSSLPKTASPLPLIGLIGLLALGGGFVLTVASKRLS
jgi:hypothetical protein